LGNDNSFNSTTTVARPRTASAALGGKYVDGFRRPSRSAPAPSTHNVTAHKPEPAKTLMRTAVKKPDIVAPSRLKAQTRTDILAKVPSQTIEPKVSHASVDAKRQKKATQTIKHPSVSRYSAESALSAIQRPAPVTAQSLHSTVHASSQSSIDHIHSSISKATGQQAVTPQPVHVAVPMVHEPKKDIFIEALARATSHEQVYEPAVFEAKKQRRGAILATSVLCLLLVAGTLAFLNAPALSVKVAAVKSGVSAKLPSFVPQGFNFGNLSYGKGNVTVSYTSATDNNKRYDITQRQSNWDSQTLLSNFVTTANNAYQTYQEAGRTVYMYGDNTATWVDSGVWYTVNGNSALSRDQILDLAGSL